MTVTRAGARGTVNRPSTSEARATRHGRTGESRPAPAPRAADFGGVRRGGETVTGSHDNVVPVGARSRTEKPLRFSLAGAYKIDVPEPSGVVFLGHDKGFFVAGDCKRALYRVDLPTEKKGKLDAEKLKSDGGSKHLAGLEGVTYDRGSGTILVVSEERNEVSEVRFTGKHLGEAEKVGKLPDISRMTNKGWEGLAVLPAGASPDGKERLLAVHEGAPRRMAILDRRTLELVDMVKLPDDAKDLLKDLSDVAVDPRTGHVFVLSDESRRVVEFSLAAHTKPGTGGMLKSSWELGVVGELDLASDDGKARLQPEGLTFDDRGDLWVVAERKQTMFHYARED